MASTFQRQIGSSTLTLETGRLAQLANGALTVQYGDSVILVAATMDKPREGIDFFPLTIDFEERLYARGKIPGSFFRREGRPSTDAILVDRLTDRPLRPLFPKGFRNEVQIVTTALSADMENPLDVLNIIGASAALCVSDIPFGGPVAATRVGFVAGRYVVNPTYDQLEQSDLDLVVAGSRHGVSMIEAGGREVSEDVVLGAIDLGQETNLAIIDMQEEMVRVAGKEKVSFVSPAVPEGLRERLDGDFGTRLSAAFDAGGSKADQSGRLEALKAEALEDYEDDHDRSDISDAFQAQADREFRALVLAKGLRPDGRGVDEIRTMTSEVSILPRTHGSGLFSRGETQVLGVATLGSVGDAAKLDTLNPQEKKRFMLHYNFPPFSTGEAGRVGSPKRRDIGHGALAERAIAPVLPSEDEFPYTVRVVADVLSSNGSTSMGSVCAGILALMDAGVPIKAPVAGISIGLITGDDGRTVTLTDIQGMEDHAGDMDFKVAGTAEGITAMQLDIKLTSLGHDVIRTALKEAREARMVILQGMAEAIAAPRTDMSPYAPRITRISIPVAKIGAVIGPGGKTIRSIIEETKATVDVQDDGTVLIGSTDEAAARRAVEIIEGLTKEAKVGDIYTGKVVRILDFGAFVEILPGKDGMVHISELADYRVATVEDEVKLGEEITVTVIGVDPSGRVALSRRALLEGKDKEDGGPPPRPAPSGPDGGDRQGTERPRSSERPGGYGQGSRPQGGGGGGDRRGGPRPGPRSGPPRR
jgi:polyribonucleotide nucleotidyltransferase